MCTSLPPEEIVYLFFLRGQLENVTIENSQRTPTKINKNDANV